MLARKLPLTIKLPALVVFMGLGAGVASAAVVLLGARSEVAGLAIDQAVERRDANVREVEHWFEDSAAEIRSLRASPTVQAALTEFAAVWRDMRGGGVRQLQARYAVAAPAGSPAGAEAEAASDPLAAYAAVHDRVHAYFAVTAAENDFHDVFLIDRQGNIVYSVAKGSDFATDLADGPATATGLANVAAAAMAPGSGDGLAVSDFEAYAPSQNSPAAFMAVPVPGPDGRPLGAVAIRLAIDRLDTIVQDAGTIGEDGQSFLIGPDGRLRTDLRGFAAPTALTATRDGEGVRAALRGESGMIWTETPEGQPVLSTYAPVRFGDITWALVTGQSRASIFAAMSSLQRGLLLQLAVAAVVITGMGVVFARRIAGPLRDVGLAVGRISARDFSGDIPATGRQDEIGTLARDLQSLRDILARADAAVRDHDAVITAIGGSQAMIEFKPDGTILRANANFHEAMGYAEAELVGQKHAIFMEEAARRAPEYRQFWTDLADGRPQAGVFHRIGKGGRDVYLQASYNPVRDQGGAVLRVVKVAADITASETARIEAAAQRARIEAALAGVVQSLSGALSLLAEGDLTARLDRAFEPEFELLRENFNLATLRLEQALAAVVGTAANIRNGSLQLTNAADDLSRRTENQAAALEETAAALEQLTASVKMAAEGAQKASAEVVTAKRNAEDGGRIVREAIDAMSEIEKSSAHISQIIGVIDDIAFQTNLLALNAGVEAARAGDAGRGFAVVASEVRALAQRSSDAAKEIKGLIAASTQHVGRGVGLVRGTGDALQTIVDSVTGITGLVSEIAVSTREQSVGLTEINTAVNQLDKVTQQNAAMVEESTAASHRMKSEAETLTELVARFQLDSVPAARASAPAAGPAPGRPTAAPARAPRPLTAGSSALATASRDPLDDWEDF